MARSPKAAAATSVGDIMTRDPVCVGPDTSARELAHLLESNEISGVPVVDNLNRVIGVVSRTDLLHRVVVGPMGTRPGTFFGALAEGLDSGSDLDPENLGPVEEFMTPDVVTASPDERLAAVARRMAGNGVHRVVVVDAGRQAIGIVTSLDLLKAFPG